jgi:CrcB protein
VITASAFAVAAALGALARAEAGRRWNRHDGFAVGTLIVNVTGSLLLGLLSDVAPPTLTVLGVGGLGAYTTFSSFARDAVALADRRSVALAGLYVGLTAGLGLAAAAVGVSLTSGW